MTVEVFLILKMNSIHYYKKFRRYQRGNQRPQIEGQTTQWAKENGQTTIYKILHRKPTIKQHESH